MDRRRRELWTSLAGTLGVLAPLALGLLGCPQLLHDDFMSARPADPSGDVPEPPLGSAGQTGAAGGGSTGSGASAGSAGTNSGTVSPVPLPDAGSPTPAAPDSGPSACVSAVETCDGRDNDCDDGVDEPPACPNDCTGVVLEGRGAMFCGGAGATFANAEARCSVQGMRPVVIDSAQKSAAVLQTILPLYTTAISEAQNSLWLDAHDDETEGTWHWGPSGTVFWLGDATGSAQNDAYVSWAAGKPNNSGSGEGEDCAVLHVDSNGPDGLGTWNDETCDGLHTFLCEAPLP